MEKNIRSRKGISMVEVVVALVVITIISLATLSVVFVSAKVEAKTFVAMEVRNSAENAVECFRFANGDKDIFRKTLNLSVGVDETVQASAWEEVENGYSYNAGRYIVTITLNKDENDKLVSFTYEAKDSAGKDIYEFTFTNGGEQE